MNKICENIVQSGDAIGVRDYQELGVSLEGIKQMSNIGTSSSHINGVEGAATC